MQDSGHIASYILYPASCILYPASRYICILFHGVHPMARYDISSKVLFQDYERDFIALALGTYDFEILGPIPIEFPSVQM